MRRSTTFGSSECAAMPHHRLHQRKHVGEASILVGVESEAERDAGAHARTHGKQNAITLMAASEST